MTDATESKVRYRYGIPAAIVAVIFGLFFVYDLFEAIGNVVGVVGGVNHTNDISEKLGLPRSATVPWSLLVFDLVLSPVAYAVAFFAGRRKPLLAKAAIFLIALAATAALILGIEEGFSKLF